MAALGERQNGHETTGRDLAATRWWVLSKLAIGLAIAVTTVAFAVYADRLFFLHPAVANAHLLANDKIDVPVLLRSIRAHPTLISTLALWHSSWTYEVAFWRPLAILAFWLEYHAFGLQFQYWTFVTLLAHLVCVALFARVAYLLSGRFDAAALAVLLFVVVRDNYYFHGAETIDCITLWKNQPDLLSDAFILGAMIATMRHKWWGALTCSILAVCFKEVGWASFLIVLGLAAIGRNLRVIPRSVYAATFISIAVLIAARFLSGHAVFVGHHDGTNSEWATRFSHAVEGYFLDYAAQDPGLGIAAFGAALALTAGWLSRSLLVRFLVFIAAVTIAALVNAVGRQCSFLVSLVALLDPKTWWPIGIIMAALVIAYFCLLANRSLRLPALYAFVIGVLLATPIAMATQVVVHVLYLASAFQGVVVACAMIAVYESLKARQCPSASVTSDT